METELAKSWVLKKLEELPITFQKGVNAKEKGEDGIAYYIPSGSNFPDGIKIEKTKKISKEILNTFKDTSILKKGDILFNSGGVGTLGRVGYFNGLELPSVADSFIIIIRTDEKYILSKYIYYWFQTIEAKILIEENTQGTTGITSIKSSDIKRFQIAIAPLKEQQKIVIKLDTIMERVNANKQRLDNIPQILKRFKQSVLATAVSGRLTEEWRKKNKVKEDWIIKRAEEICELITKGTTPTNGGMTSTGEVPYLKVYNIVDQKIDFNYKPQFVSKEIHNNLLKRSRVYPGDVLMNIVGPPLGKVAKVTDEYPEWNINQAIAFFRPKSEIITDYLYILLCEGSPIVEIEKEFRGTAGQSNISLEQCRNFKFPLPTIKEQQEISKKVNRLFALSDNIEERYNNTKKQLDRFPQSILAKAFRGELL